MPVADFSLTDRVAIVTGASRGIGESIARGFVEHGAKVVISSRKQEGLDKVAATMPEGAVLPVACHGGKREDMEALFERVEQEFGRLDILVNNAGTNPYFGPGMDAPESTIDKTIEVNLKGYYLMMQLAGRMMRKTGGGSIINMASIAGLRPGNNETTYSMTKAGVISLTKSFAKELGPDNIRVNAIAPGVVETYFANALIETEERRQGVIGRTPLGRWGQPNEIAGAAIFLASDASSYATGSVIVLDGGSTA